MVAQQPDVTDFFPTSTFVIVIFLLQLSAWQNKKANFKPFIKHELHDGLKEIWPKRKKKQSKNFTTGPTKWYFWKMQTSNICMSSYVRKKSKCCACKSENTN